MAGAVRMGLAKTVSRPVASMSHAHARSGSPRADRVQRDLVAVPPERTGGGRPGFLAHLAAEFGGVVEQDLVEARTLDLIGIIQPWDQSLGKFDLPGQHALVGDVELRPVLRHEPGALHLVPDADVAQDRVGHRHDRLADVKAREPLFLDDQHAQPRAGEVSAGRAAGRAAADDDGVEVEVLHGD